MTLLNKIPTKQTIGFAVALATSNIAYAGEDLTYPEKHISNHAGICSNYLNNDSTIRKFNANKELTAGMWFMMNGMAQFVKGEILDGVPAYKLSLLANDGEQVEKFRELESTLREVTEGDL